MSKNIFLYLRVSTQGQELDNNKADLLIKAEKMKLLNGNNIIWLEEIKSGTKHFKFRELNKVITTGKSGDFLIASEISRIGRNSLEIFEFFSLSSQIGIEIHFVKNDLKLDGSIQSQMILSMYIFFSQIERELIVSRTKTGLIMAKKKGEKLGRPNGSLCLKLDPYILNIKKSIDSGIKLSSIATSYNVSTMTISKFIKRYNLKYTNYLHIEKEFIERTKNKNLRKELIAIKLAKRKETRITQNKS